MSIQLENMVPEYYINKSRDFQLLCRTLNIFLSASEEQSKKIISNWDVDTLDESLLFLMLRRLGLPIDAYIPPKILRNLCRVYPRILRYKGTLQAVRDAAFAVFSAYLEIYSLVVQYKVDDSSTILIISSASWGDEYYLNLILPFILPAGIAWEYMLGLRVRRTLESSYKPVNIIYRIRGRGQTISRIMGGITLDYSGEFDKTGVEWDTVPGDETSSTKQYSRVGFALITNSTITNSTENIGWIYQDKSITDNTK